MNKFYNLFFYHILCCYTASSFNYKISFWIAVSFLINTLGYLYVTFPGKSPIFILIMKAFLTCSFAKKNIFQFLIKFMHFFSLKYFSSLFLKRISHKRLNVRLIKNCTSYYYTHMCLFLFNTYGLISRKDNIIININISVYFKKNCSLKFRFLPLTVFLNHCVIIYC